MFCCFQENNYLIRQDPFNIIINSKCCCKASKCDKDYVIKNKYKYTRKEKQNVNPAVFKTRKMCGKRC